jgi:glutathione S-transferase
VSDFFQVYETQAIIRYIDRVLPRPPLTPGNPQAAGRMDQFVIGFQRVVGRRLMGLTPERAPLTAKHSNLRAWLIRMNARPSVVATTWSVSRR